MKFSLIADFGKRSGIIIFQVGDLKFHFAVPRFRINLNEGIMRKRLFNTGFVIVLCFFSISSNTQAFWNSDVKKAKEFMELNMYPQAIEVLNKRIMEKPTDDEAHFLLGICLLIRGRYSEGDQSFSRAVKLDSDWGFKIGDQYMNMGNSALTSGNINNAKMLFFKAIDYEPTLREKIAEECFNVGKNYLLQNDVRSAGNCFSISASIFESYRKKIAYEYKRTGDAFLNNNRLLDAKSMYILAIQYNPNVFKDVYAKVFDYGNQALKNNRYNVSEKAFAIANELDPASIEKIFETHLKNLNLSKVELENDIISFYNNKGEWAGVFEIESIEKMRIVHEHKDLKDIHVKYKYKPIPNNPKGRTDSGYDQRIFLLKNVDGVFRVVNMLGHQSAKF